MNNQNRTTEESTAEKLSQIKLIKHQYLAKMKELNHRKIEILKKYDQKLKELNLSRIRKNIED